MRSTAKCLFPHPHPSRPPRLLLPPLEGTQLPLQPQATRTPAAPGDLSAGLSSLPACPPRAACPVPPRHQGQTCCQARRGRTLGPCLKASVAAGPAARVLLTVRSPCALGSFPLTPFSASFQKGKESDVPSPPRTGPASRAPCLLSFLCIWRPGRSPGPARCPQPPPHLPGQRRAGWSLPLLPRQLKTAVFRPRTPPGT